MDVNLESERLRLRKVSLTDVSENYVKWMNDQEVNQYMETRFRQQTISEIMQYVTSLLENPNILFLAIIIQETNSHIGNIKLEISPHHQRGEISLWIGDNTLWGKGLATEAVDLLKEYAFKVLGLYKLTSGCYSCNKASEKLFLKSGFHQEAVLKNHYICGNIRTDRLCFACYGSDG